MKFRHIPQLTRSASYRVHQSWKYIKETLERYQSEECSAKLDLNPEFQRGHVWTEKQQIDYVEFKLKGGEGSDLLFFNCIGWMKDFKGPFVLVDGKQRLQAVSKFMDSKLPIFGGYYYKDFEYELLSMYPTTGGGVLPPPTQPPPIPHPTNHSSQPTEQPRLFVRTPHPLV